MRKASSSAAENDNAIVLAQYQCMSQKCIPTTYDVGRLFGFQSVSRCASAIGIILGMALCAHRIS